MLELIIEFGSIYIGENLFEILFSIAALGIGVNIISPSRNFSFGSSFNKAANSTEADENINQERCIEADHSSIGTAGKTLEINNAIPAIQDSVSGEIEFQLAIHDLHNAINFCKNCDQQLTASVFHSVKNWHLSTKHYHELWMEFAKAVAVEHLYSHHHNAGRAVA